MTSKIVKLSLAMALVTLSGLSLADAAKDRIDPKVHDKMLHGDAPTPQIVEKTDMGAQASPSRQQIRNDRGGKFENLYIN